MSTPGESINNQHISPQSNKPKPFKSRQVANVVKNQRTQDGKGVFVYRSIYIDPIYYNPFLLFDHLQIDNPPINNKKSNNSSNNNNAAAFPPHPHRGIATLSYIINGSISHQDHLGNQGECSTGDAQYMRAGRGIVHSEVPGSEGMMEGVQLWINLNKVDKMSKPKYQKHDSSKTPELILQSGKVNAKVIIGEICQNDSNSNGIRDNSNNNNKGEHHHDGTNNNTNLDAVNNTHPNANTKPNLNPNNINTGNILARSKVQSDVPMHFIHYTLQPDTTIHHTIPSHWNTFVYVLSGSGIAGDITNGTNVEPKHSIFFDQGIPRSVDTSSTIADNHQEKKIPTKKQQKQQKEVKPKPVQKKQKKKKSMWDTTSDEDDGIATNGTVGLDDDDVVNKKEDVKVDGKNNGELRNPVINANDSHSNPNSLSNDKNSTKAQLAENNFGITMNSGKKGLSFILVAGEPLPDGNTVESQGGVVMNTKAEVKQAYDDFQMEKRGFEGAGTFIKSWKK